MEIKKEDKEIIIRKKLGNNETYTIQKKGKFETISFYKKPRLVKGVSSTCSDGKDVLFIDYDNTSIEIVYDDYLLLQEMFNLPQAYLFSPFLFSSSLFFVKTNFFTMFLYCGFSSYSR